MPQMPQMPFAFPMPGGAPWEWPGRMEEFWEQQREMQKSSMKAAKEWWDVLFG